MGLLDKLRSKAQPPAPPPPELPPEYVAAAEDCHRSGKDVFNLTRGKGSAQQMSVAGTAYRPDALRYAASLAQSAEGGKLAGVVLREPTNAHDPNAVRVLVAGVGIGYLPAYQAKLWQPTLVECEKRGLLLVGSVRLVTKDIATDAPGAVISLRDGLPGFEGPVSALRAEEYAKNKAVAKERARLRAEAAVLLEGDRLAETLARLERLERQEPVRTKQKAGLVVRQVRELLPSLRGHADALEAAHPSDELLPFTEHVDNLEGSVDDLLEAEDADEREDLHLDLQGALDDLLTEFRKLSA